MMLNLRLPNRNILKYSIIIFSRVIKHNRFRASLLHNGGNVNEERESISCSALSLDWCNGTNIWGSPGWLYFQVPQVYIGFMGWMLDLFPDSLRNLFDSLMMYKY